MTTTSEIDVKAGGSSPENEVELVERLRLGDDAAFGFLLDRYHVPMIRLARSYVSTNAAAEDVVQETWMAVVRGIGRFESRASIKTWLFRILVNRAKSRGVQESKSVPFSSVDDDGWSVDPDRFLDNNRRCGVHWSAPPSSWRDGPELNALSGETRRSIGEALAGLPAMQQAVVTLRDVHGLNSDEVCKTLDLSKANQRVLLHRGRSKIRTVLASEFRAPRVDG